jgi:hypothetical protein
MYTTTRRNNIFLSLIFSNVKRQRNHYCCVDEGEMRGSQTAHTQIFNQRKMEKVNFLRIFPFLSSAAAATAEYYQ